MPTDVADAGFGVPYVLTATSEEQRFDFKVWQRSFSLRNTGMNALWLSIDDRKTWFHVPSGTSWDDRIVIGHFWYCTQTGKTTFEALGTRMEIWSGDMTGIRTDASVTG